MRDVVAGTTRDRLRPDERAGAWTIGEVARLAGVTTRTLRHYDAVGLLRPAGVAAGGRRLYGQAELLRLQQVLVLRELGVDLPTVAAILADGGSGTGPEADAVRLRRLREHHTRLVAERDRFDRLAATVESTLRALEEGIEMAAKDLYAGFDNSQYEAEARERYGDEEVDGSNAAWERLGPDGRAAFTEESAAVGQGLAALMTEGADVADAPGPGARPPPPRPDRAVLGAVEGGVRRARPDVRRRRAVHGDVRRVRPRPRAVPA